MMICVGIEIDIFVDAAQIYAIQSIDNIANIIICIFITVIIVIVVSIIVFVDAFSDTSATIHDTIILAIDACMTTIILDIADYGIKLGA